MIDRVAVAVGGTIEYLVGTMIEIPRAALLADQIAEQAEFFSFGTNDLTQLTFGYSRDDAGKFLPEYVAQGILAERSVPKPRSRGHRPARAPRHRAGAAALAKPSRWASAASTVATLAQWVFATK